MKDYLNSLNLGEDARQMFTKILEWKAWDNAWQADKQIINKQIFEEKTDDLVKAFDYLSKTCPSDFQKLLSVVDLSPENNDPSKEDLYNIPFHNKLFFCEYLDSSPERKQAFLSDCTDEQLFIYVRNQCAYWFYRHEKPDFKKNYQELTEKLKTIINECCKLINDSKTLNPNDADFLRVLIIKLLANQYSYINPQNAVEIAKNIKIKHRPYYLNKINEVLFCIGNVNVNTKNMTHSRSLLYTILSLNGNDNPLLPQIMQSMTNYLLSKNIKITTGEGEHQKLDFPIHTKIANDDNVTYDFLSAAFKQNPDINEKAIKLALQHAIEWGNTGAIKALVEYQNIRKIAPERSEYIAPLAQDQGRVFRQTIHGVANYLAMTKSSISEVLNDVAKNNPDKMNVYMENIFGIGERTHEEDKDFYPTLEEQEAKNVFYFFAENANNLRFANIKHLKTCATEKMITKSDPTICPLTIAGENKNIGFLLFVLQIMEFKITTGSKLANRITDCICELVKTGTKPNNIVEQLQSSTTQYINPLKKFVCFEAQLLASINNAKKPEQPKQNRRLSLKN